METRSKRRKTAESIVDKIQCGEISIFVALAEELPDVFASEILPKLDVWTTLNLAQVSKSYNDAVWSVDGVRSMEAKIRTHLDNLNHPKTSANPVYWAARHGNLPAVRALLESGLDVNKGALTRPLLIAVSNGREEVVKALIEAGADVNLKTSGNGRLTLPLVAAAFFGRSVCIALLLDAGADVDKQEEMMDLQHFSRQLSEDKMRWSRYSSTLARTSTGRPMEGHLFSGQL